MDIDPGRLSSAVQNIYAATLDPADRPALAHQMAQAFDGTSCLIHTRDQRPAGVSIIGGTANCTAFLPAYVEYYHARDAWTERAKGRLNQAFLGEEVVGADELLAAEWYNDLLRRHEIHHLVAAAFELETGAIGAIGVHRPSDAAGFENRDRDMLNLLVPHLRQALRLIRRLDANERARQLSFDALAALSVAVFVVGADNRVRLMNEAAERVVTAGCVLRVRNGRLSLASPGLDDRLRAAIAKAALAPVGKSVFPGETIVAAVGEGRCVSLLVTPLPPDVATSGPAEPLAAVFVSDPAAGAEPSPDLVRAVYGLTPAEARVLSGILKGQSLADYAVQAGISGNTVYAQLKSIFAKTGCHRQAELVRKILSNPLLRLSKNPRR